MPHNHLALKYCLWSAGDDVHFGGVRIGNKGRALCCQGGRRDHRRSHRGDNDGGDADNHGHGGQSRDHGRGHDRNHHCDDGLIPCCHLDNLHFHHNEHMWEETSRAMREDR